MSRPRTRTRYFHACTVIRRSWYGTCNTLSRHTRVLLCQVAMTGRGSFLQIPLDATQARDNRNGLVKHVYGQASNRGVVLQIAECCASGESTSESSAAGTGRQGWGVHMLILNDVVSAKYLSHCLLTADVDL